MGVGHHDGVRQQQWRSLTAIRREARAYIEGLKDEVSFKAGEAKKLLPYLLRRLEDSPIAAGAPDLTAALQAHVRMVHLMDVFPDVLNYDQAKQLDAFN